ncbi:MAG: DUF4830 domain-containing protein [Eubacteriales bacterium]|nr:DUF4830 domain-containing protein [Eubacteriales bacterium]
MKKVMAGVLLVGAAVLGVAIAAPQAAETASAPAEAQGMALDSKLKTNEQRVALLASYGWQVEPEPRSEREVQIPKTFDETYQAYNAIQRAQGLDLVPYQGKRAMLYTYELLDYPTGAAGVTANLLIRRDRLIAADISAAEADGFVHGLTERPDGASQTPPAQTPSAADGQQPDGCAP